MLSSAFTSVRISILVAVRAAPCQEWILRAALAAALITVAMPAVAQRVKEPESRLDKLSFSKRELRLSQTLVDAATIRRLPYRAELDRFRSAYGAGWRFVIDQRTGRPNLLDGGAIPFAPGPANGMQEVGAVGCRLASCAEPARMEALARDFLQRNQAVLQVDPKELVLYPGGSLPVGNSMLFIRFQWIRGGVPVEGAAVSLAVNNGNLVQVGIQNIGNFGLDTKPRLTLEAAWKTLRTFVGGATDRDQAVSQSLVILPVTPKGMDPDSVAVPFGRMIDYVLVYKLAFRRPETRGTWEALVDAHSGELLRFRDSDVYGHVQGGVYRTDKPQTEVSTPFPFVDYGAGTYADAAGNFGGIAGTATMTGPTAGGAGMPGGVKITDGCGGLNGISLGANGVGIIDFGSSAGTDCATPGVGLAGNTHAARTQYWNLTQIKLKGITYLPSNSWLNAQLQTSVNINSWCNAQWNGILNFYQSTSLCNNTGELPGISLHEWGHGMDANDGSGAGTDNRPVETRADFTALLQTHQSCAGSGLFLTQNCSGYGDPCQSCSGVREADWALHSHNTPWTPQNNGSVYNCAGGPYNGPCGWEDHCESGIATQALWDFVNRDLTTLTPVTAWQLEDRLFYTAMPQSSDMYTCTGTTVKTSNGCGAGSLYTVMRAIDDDGDGTANGTPHGAAIFAALNRHGIACGLPGDATNQNQTSCPSLIASTLTATASANQVNLNWSTGGANATRYFIFRNETGCTAGFTKIATVNAPATTYTDTGVAHGVVYYYRVQAATANDSCVSPMSSCATITARLPADKDFYVRDWTSNASSHDLGEEPSTNYATNWAWTSDVWNRGVNSPGAASSDWFPTDNVYAGAGALGDNWGFVRVHRNSSGSPATVTAKFLVSEFGVGSNFLPVATTTLNFAAGDTALTQGAMWNRPVTSSTHACIAAQISTVDDPYQAPDLTGNSPGQVGGQALILVDNNKAQRNLGVSLNVPHLIALNFAFIHNPSLVRRDVVLRYDTAEAGQLRGAQVEIPGGTTVDLTPGGNIVLPGMEPGEGRWIALKALVPAGKPVPVHFYQMDKGWEVNAFTLEAQPVSLATAMRDNLRSHVQVFNRLGAAFGTRNAGAEAEAAARLVGLRQLSAAQYLGFLKSRAKGIVAILTPLVAPAGAPDSFGLLRSASDVGSAVAANRVQQAVANHSVLLHRLDAFATMLQLSAGNPADVVQMVSWQEELFRTHPALRKLECSAAVLNRSQEFINSYRPSAAEPATAVAAPTPDPYGSLLRTLSPCFAQTVNLFGGDRSRLAAVAAPLAQPQRSLAATERAHREYLLVLRDAAQN